MVQLTLPMIAVGWVVNLFQRGTASVVRIDELLKQQPAIADDPAALTDVPTNPCPITQLSDMLENRLASGHHLDRRHSVPNLTFAYPTGPNVLHDINLDIPAGTSLAIVGPTGSGKSTLVNLIPRLLRRRPRHRPHRRPPHPQLHPRRPPRATSASSRRRPSSSPTPSARTSPSAAPTPPSRRDPRAATIAHIATEILEFPRGFDTMVGERGITLSGGQKQRTAIARAVIRNPRILILDDALASVDTYTEEHILSGLRDVMQGRTTIFISHRISTARNADQIAVLVAGRIAELGTHDELLARNGYYTSLFEKQRLEEELAVTT